MKKKLIVSVTSDLVTDQRVHKVSQTLHNDGFDVRLVGRVLPGSLPLHPRAYRTIRLKLWFSKTALFYMNFNIRLFFLLLISKADLLLANDLDTLPANYLASRIKGIPLVYDSHEYFTGVPELQQRPLIRKIWEVMEGFIFPGLRDIYTVNQSIANLYRNKYHKEVRVVRNIPYLSEQPVIPPAYPAGQKIILYQGSGINVNRGAEELVLSMKYLPADAYQLWIVGGGDVFEQLKSIAAENNLQSRIRFVNKVPFRELRSLTLQAHLGISIDKPTNINYFYSLPNKIFDYIHAGIPVLCSALPEIQSIVNGYQVGSFISEHDPRHIAEKIEYMFADKERYMKWRENTLPASRELCWQREGLIISGIFHPYLSDQK